MYSPMKEGIQLRVLRPIDIMVVGKNLIGIVLHWFCHAEIHEPNPHARSKQHGYPGKKRIFWSAVVRPEPYIPEFTEHKIDQKQHKDSDRPHVYPIQVDKNKLFDTIQPRSEERRVGKECRSRRST